ncbi:MAG: HEPN domain-containing protein [Candidatus Magasanikbacteria bacterium]
MSKKNKEIQIFNLEFPNYTEDIKISDYIFSRVKNYEKAHENMMWLVNSSGSEFKSQIKNGSHQITAVAKIPEKEKKNVLPFGTKNLKQIDDILFLLTIFTDRNVFQKNWADNRDTVIITDHRIHQYGGQLRCSIKYEPMWKEIKSGKLKTEKDIKGKPIWNYEHIDVGFEKTINKVLDLISSKKWQDEYEGGYFLFLFKSAIQRQIIETSFISCWTIWEHIFAIKNRKWLDNKTIGQMSGDKKIAFILNEYFLKEINDIARKNIQKINKTRNRLVHFGKKTEQIDYKEMEMFIRLTEQLIATILELSPSNIFNSFEALDSFLKK